MLWGKKQKLADQPITLKSAYHLKSDLLRFQNVATCVTTLRALVRTHRHRVLVRTYVCRAFRVTPTNGR
jgi:hypothetical protein